MPLGESHYAILGFVSLNHLMLIPKSFFVLYLFSLFNHNVTKQALLTYSGGEKYGKSEKSVRHKTLCDMMKSSRQLAVSMMW